MKQWWVIPGDRGGELELRDVDTPEAGPNRVLIEIHSTGVNRGEIIGMAAMQSANPAAKPRPSGIEFAGEVIALGEGVTNWAVGDRVMGRGSACHAEYVVAQADSLMAIPKDMTFGRAAAIPNVFVTAHNAMVTAAAIKAGETVLITAGSSGVGSAAIQIARHLGARHVVATTRNDAKNSSLAAVGATHIVNTAKDDWPGAVRDQVGEVHVVIDQVGGAMFPGMLATMGVGARYVSVGRTGGAHTDLDLDLMSKNRLVLIGVTFRTRTPEEALACSTRFAEDLLPAFSSGELRPVLDRSFALNDLPGAHDYMKSDQQFGKVVLSK